MVPPLGPPGPLSTSPAHGTGRAEGPTGGATALDRHIALDGVVNFRDLGGYRTADGRTVRWRTLFRADDLSRLSGTDRATVRTFGIATVIDLRSAAEVEIERFPVGEIPVTFHHLPLVAHLPPFDEFRAGPEVFAGHYRDMARASGDQVARAVAVVAEPQSHPVIVHCAAGKDRTGVLVAVLLALLGVPDETIAEDYALSARAMGSLLERLLERLPAQAEEIRTVAATMFSATPANIAAMLHALRDDHGSVEGYVAAHGISHEVVVRLRDALLE